MLSWLSFIPFIGKAFDTINGITNAIANERIALTNATTDQARIKSEENIKSLEAQRDVLVEDSKHSSLDIWIRAGLASGPIFILNKVFIYDKAFDGTTTMSPDLWNVVYVVLGFYFAHLVTSWFRK